MKNIVLTLLILISYKGHCCVCSHWFNTNIEENKSLLSNGNDDGFYATTIKILHISPWSKSGERGDFILMKVDSVFKGNLSINDTVLILQNSGNCNVSFAISESSYVYGLRIKKIKTEGINTYEKKKYWNRRWFWFSVGYNKEFIAQYKNLLKKYSGINTNQCDMFK